MTDEPYDPYGKQKQAAGNFAVIVWLVSGIYLMWTHPTASILSWQTAVYFVVGMFGAAVIFGIVFHGLQQGLSKLLANLVQEPSDSTATGIYLLGIVLLIIEAIVIFVIADWTINRLFA